MSKDASEYITDAVARIIANDNDEYDGRGNVTRIGLYHGTRNVIMSAYVESYDHDISPLGRHHATARVRAQDALAEYIVEKVNDDSPGEYLVQTLVQSALDLVDWRDLTRSILNSIGENHVGYYDLDQCSRDAIILLICREETGAV